VRIPASWLGEYVDLPDDVTVEHLHEALVKVGFEEEDSHGFDLTGPVVVGKVVSFEPEPQSNGKTINWCQVDVGEAEPRGIVCGAHNFAVGDKVVVSLPGAVLPGPFPIAARKTYGHTSDGMIASARELGLGDEHDGILLLSSLGLDPEVGVDAIELLGLNDFAVEINVTPDRGYAFSIRGVAREYSHSTGAAFRDPGLIATTPASGFEVRIEDDAPIRGVVGASVFTTRVVRGIDPTRPTPPWMLARLRLAGVRSISLPVDITNYVMFELGQPTHAYDLATLRGAMVVRRARAGETLATLDGQERKLSAEDLLITDDSGAIGLAGVMGGLSTEVTDATTDVLIEAANFDPVSIARTARRHKLPSEASKRFERGVDHAMSPAAAQRVVDLLVELAGGTADTLGTSYSTATAPAPITLPDDFVSNLIGVRYSSDEVTGSLELIGATVTAGESALIVTPPSWRPDLTDAPTLAEEVARIIGFDRIPSVLPVAPPGMGLTRSQRLRRLAADALALGGLTEVLSYPFTDEPTTALFGSPSGEAVPVVKLANALDAEAPFLRTSLIPGLADIAHRNASRGLTDLALFEIGHVFLPTAGARVGSGPVPPSGEFPGEAKLAELNAGIPPQPWVVSALFVGDVSPKQPGSAAVPSGLADALGVVTTLAASLAVELRIEKGAHAALHPGRTAAVFAGEVLVGFAGELLPAIALERNLPRTVAVVELNLDLLIEHAAVEIIAQPIATYPAATQDLSLVVPVSVAAGDLLAVIIEGAGDLLEDARLVDDYRGAGVDEGSKSLTYALRFRASDRTLTAAEATAAKTAAVELAATKFGATLRD
jgi:phenylalanyl-tRNA synthetase beta chain